jgi:DNA-binding response OmpR family regulator
MASIPLSSGAVNRRVLLACSDQRVRERTLTALRSVQVDVAEAQDHQTALALFARESFPVVILDHTLGATESLPLVPEMRAIAVQSVYVIMMTSETASASLERGYCAGVDQHMARDAGEGAIKERVETAFRAMALRRQSGQLAFKHDVVTVDLASGAHTARHLVGRLSAEIKLAQHSRRLLDIAIVCVQCGASDAAEDQLEAVLDAVRDSVRPKSDWIARLHSVHRSHRLAIVMPDSPPGRAATLEQNVRNAFVMSQPGHGAPEISVGHITFRPTADEALPAALDLLAQAEANRAAAEPADKKRLPEAPSAVRLSA